MLQETGVLGLESAPPHDRLKAYNRPPAHSTHFDMALQGCVVASTGAAQGETPDASAPE